MDKNNINESKSNNIPDGLYEATKVADANRFNEWYESGKMEVYKTKQDINGNACADGNWFMVVAALPTGQITKQYKLKDWDLFQIPEYEKAINMWDNIIQQEKLERQEKPNPIPKENALDQYYLEFLKELAYGLEHHDKDAGQWADWMAKALKRFEQEKDLSHFFSAFGGCGSFNDNSFSPPTEILASLTFNIGKAIQEDKEVTVFDIIEKENQRCQRCANSQMADFYDAGEYQYMDYLAKNYQPGNLHDITEKYRNEKNDQPAKHH